MVHLRVGRQRTGDSVRTQIAPRRRGSLTIETGPCWCWWSLLTALCCKRREELQVREHEGVR